MDILLCKYRYGYNKAEGNGISFTFFPFFSFSGFRRRQKEANKNLKKDKVFNFTDNALIIADFLMITEPYNTSNLTLEMSIKQ